MEEPCPIDLSLIQFQELVQKPEIFLNCEESFSQQLKLNLKCLYDTLKLQELLSSNALPALLIKDFETEQLWQQLELQNEDFLTHSMSNISRVLSNQDQLVFNSLQHDIKCNTSNLDEKLLQGDQSNDESVETSSDQECESERESSSRGLVESDQEFLSENDAVDKISVTKENFDSRSTKTRKSIIDDDFFKLDEMESFLKAEENKLGSKNDDSKEEPSDSDEEGSIDLFKFDSDNEENDKVRKAKFKDFFISKTEYKQPIQNKFLQDIDSEYDEMAKSSFELRQDRLQKKIDELEETAVAEKPWTLQGEISADSRPQNSLLEEIVEFDLTSRPSPVITEKVTHQLEDLIKQRIKSKQFDSVARKAKPVENLLEYKKKIILDQEKSKHSLAQIYEKEFLDQQRACDPKNAERKEEEPVLHEEIKTMMRNLFNKLDALSNFHFTPKPAVPELKIVTNLPAIFMEEVAPITASVAMLLAPEEIRKKTKGDVIGKSERTKTDKKRERRKKKLKQKLHVKQTVNKNLITMSKSNKNSSRGKNLQKTRETSHSKSLKSSSAFFTQLQEQVQSTLKTTKVGSSLDKSNKKITAQKLKL